MKYFVVILFLLASLTLKSQSHLYGSDVIFLNGSFAKAGTLNGTLFYDLVSNTFQFRQNGIWSAPWPLNGSGSFTGAVNINGSGNTFSLSNTALTTVTSAADFNFGMDNGTVFWEYNGANNGLFTGRQTFTPTATLSGFNPGSRISDPSSLQNFDLWGRSDLNKARIRINGVTENIETESHAASLYATGAGSGSANRMAYWTNGTNLSFGPHWDNSNIRLGVGGVPTYTIDAQGAGGTTIRVTTSGNAAPAFNISRTGTTPSDWVGYIPTGMTGLRWFHGSNDRVIFVPGATSTELRTNAPPGGTPFVELTENDDRTVGQYWDLYKDQVTDDFRVFNGSDRFIITSAGVLKIPTVPSTDNTNTNILTRDGSGNIEIKTDIIDGSGSSNGLALFSDANTITNDLDATFNGGNTLRIGAGSSNTQIGPVGGISNVVITDGTQIATLSPSGLAGSGAGTINITNSGSGNNINVSGTSGSSVTIGGVSHTGSITLHNTSGADVTINTDDITISNAPDAGASNTAILTRNTSTGEVETRTITLAQTTYTDYGTATPTASNLTNAASVSPSVFIYTQNGANVTFAGTVVVDPTVAGQVTFNLTIPNANGATFVALTDVAAVAQDSTSNYAGNASADIVNNKINIVLQCTTDVGTLTVKVTGMYIGAAIP